MCLYHRHKVMSPKHGDKMANSVDPDQTAPLCLIWVYTVCSGLSGISLEAGTFSIIAVYFAFSISYLLSSSKWRLLPSTWLSDILAHLTKNLGLLWYFCKFPKYSDTQNICCNHSKMWTMLLYHRVMSPNDADGMANSVDPDPPLGAVWSGSPLFAQAYLSENLGSLR